MKSSRLRQLNAMLLLTLLSATPWAHAQDSSLSQSGQALIKTAAPSVVTIGSVVNVDAGMMGGASDEEILTLGVVVDPSGLVVVSRAALNPQGYEPIEFEPQPGMQVRIEAELTSVWIQLPDGSRMDAQIVLTDPNLDLSFIQPVDAKQAEAHKFKAVQFSKQTPSLLENVLCLGRLNENVGWAPQIEVRRVTSILDTPWNSYVVAAEPGEAVFNSAGQFLGVMVVVPRTGPVDGMAMMMGGGRMALGPTVLLPGARIQKLVAQARNSLPVKPKKKPKTARREQPSQEEMEAAFAPSVEAGTDAPLFTLVDDLGKEHSLEKYRGKFVLLDWWGIW